MRKKRKKTENEIIKSHLFVQMTMPRSLDKHTASNVIFLFSYFFYYLFFASIFFFFGFFPNYSIMNFYGLSLRECPKTISPQFRFSLVTNKSSNTLFMAVTMYTIYRAEMEMREKKISFWMNKKVKIFSLSRISVFVFLSFMSSTQVKLHFFCLSFPKINTSTTTKTNKLAMIYFMSSSFASRNDEYETKQKIKEKKKRRQSRESFF